ncbi:MAG: Pup--protein ligase [Actinomycetaceae bacterium]|nr:Pup--protein ligase [Actinomycetaceae bacterium]
MNRRIIGLETEYGLASVSPSGAHLDMEAEDAAQYLFHDVLEYTRSTNTFLPNGARLYLDVGAHPEYATAECDSLTDLIANDRAGDIIYAQMAKNATQHMAEKGIDGQLHLFKNNVDSHGNSYGCHENYLVRRRRDFRARIDSLIPYFVSRQIMVGAGYLRRDEDGVSYELSQRAEHMDDAVSAASTRTRPMINTRDEPHGDAELYRRMHVIVGDSSMSEPTTLLKVGATEALLNVIEDGGRLPDMTLAKPTEAIRHISRDLSGKAVVERAQGGTISALDIQHVVYSFVTDHYTRQGWFAELDPTRQYMFDLWKRTLEGLSAGDMSAVRTEIDWVAKRDLFERYMARLGVGLDDDRIARLDLAWHDITAHGLRDKLEAAGLLRTVLDPALAQQATGIPPQTTRAKLRGDFVALAQELRHDYMADWSNLRLLTNAGAVTVLLQDPFAAVDERVDKLMEQMEHHE